MAHSKHPFWKDPSLYVAIAPIAIALAPNEVKAWIHANPAALAPVTMWMAAHHWLAGKRVDGSK